MNTDNPFLDTDSTDSHGFNLNHKSEIRNPKASMDVISESVLVVKG
jgi:hypothetical protein